MALPLIAVGANVSARIGPWLARMGPAAWKKASEALSAAGTHVRNPGELVNLIKNNKLATGSVLYTLADAGFSVSDLFSPEDKVVTEVREFVADLAQREIGKMNPRVIDNAATSENLAGLASDPSDLRLLRDVCRFAVAHYGGAGNARKAFLMHQAFFELSQNDLETGLELLV